MVWRHWVTKIQQRFRHGDRSDRYDECPLCRHGTLTPLVMMDAMSCNFCRHIFSIDPHQPLVQPPILRTEDTAQPLAWQWSGQRWQAQSQVNPALILWLWLLCIAIVTLPSSLMGLAVTVFPADPHSRGAWFPVFWLGLTLAAHSAIAIWLLAEHYQWPLYQRLKLFKEQLTRLLDRG